MSGSCDRKSVADHLDTVLAPRVFLVGYSLTIADVAVFAGLKGQSHDSHMTPKLACNICNISLLLGIFGDLIPTGQNLQRWYKFLSEQDAIKYALSKLHLQPVGSQSGEVSESSL